MIAVVRTIHIFALAAVTLLSGCHLLEQSGKCAPIGVVTRVIVSSQGTEPATDRTVITDPERIRELAAFANARRKCSQPMTYTMPAPQVTAVFYDKADFLGAIGAGSNFFFVSCQNWRGIRNATDAELKDFKRLISNVN